MLSEIQFENSIRDLELMFGTIEQDSRRRDDKIAIYYERLRNTSEKILKKAIKYLVDVHPYKRFPLVQELRNAIDQVVRSSSVPSQQDLENRSLVTCEACQGTGHVLKDVIEVDGYKHTVANPCQCLEGDQVRTRWEALKRRG